MNLKYQKKKPKHLTLESNPILSTSKPKTNFHSIPDMAKSSSSEVLFKNRFMFNFFLYQHLIK